MKRRSAAKKIVDEIPLKNFSKNPEIMEFPDLVEIQKTSYNQFIAKEGSVPKVGVQGLNSILKEIFPITDPNERATLEFVDYSIGEPRYAPSECIERGVSYSVPIKISVRLHNKLSGEVKEEEVLLGDLPFMTDQGTFIINGVERIVVNQLHRAPGVFYGVEIFPRGERQYSTKIIPYWGAWLEFKLESNNTIQMSIDRKRKMPATILLKALGYTEEKIMRIFSGLKEINIGEHSPEELIGRRVGEDIRDKDGTVIVDARNDEPINQDTLKLLKKKDIERIKLLGNEETDAVFPNTLKRDRIANQEEALTEIYRRLRPNEPATHENGKILLDMMFFTDPRRYSLGEIGRYRLNKRLGLETPPNMKTLSKEDIVAVIKGLLNLKKNRGAGDDVDHLGNRKVASVGELLENQFRKIMLQLARIMRERMSTLDIDSAMPHSLIVTKPVVEGINNFFGMSQLSQFMDQTNPLAELTHKRRLSALGPGGLTRDRAGFEVRDVHLSHYGRVCPVETPEGPNIGLIVSLSTYARTNSLGLLESPYRKVVNGRVTNKIEYLTADIEDEHVIAQANAPLEANGRFKEKQVSARTKSNFILVDAAKVDFMDVSPKQLISISAGLIPFLEHDDANRALMGCNMQRQSVPLILPEPPIIITGMEKVVAKNSGRAVIAKKSGTVKYVDARKIVIESRNKKGRKETSTYIMDKYLRSNQSTCLNQRPTVMRGQKVSAGQIVSDGPSIVAGELSMGRNVLVAYLPWEGYNFEDAILLNEKLVKEDAFSSIHIEENKVEVRDTKMGEEEITRDIPNVSEESLKDLDENGIVRIGADVKDGDILVGKVTPREEIWLSAEEKLLRAIFGEKAKKVRDTSLRVPPGYNGKVIETKVFSRADGDELPLGVSKLIKIFVAQKRKVSEGDKMAGRHGNKGVVAKILPEESMPYLEDGTPIEVVLNPLGVPSRMNIGQLLEVHLGLAAKALGLRVMSPVFEGASEEEIRSLLRKAKLPESGKMKIYNGRTGEPFDSECTVGNIYMMKLYHMVDDKMHARSIGPYSLVTQQPLGGKAQFGGQRLGEMEVWALEAYGAAYTLQEMLTVKSDDTIGRSNLYEAIVKGKISPKIGIPESFNVLVRELQGLSLNISFLDKKGRLLNIENLSKRDEEGDGAVLEDIVSIRICLASPEVISGWSHGEVKKPETINYRTFRPEREGLFCEKIFGPTRDWRCFCGKYEGLRYKGITCDRCDVEVTESSVRKVRMGHIALACPVSHIWYIKEIPSPVAVLLDITGHDLESVLYFEKYIVIDPGKSSFKKKELIDEDEYRKYKEEKHGDTFKAKMGAEAIKDLLSEVDLKLIVKDLQDRIKKDPALQKNKKFMRKIELAQTFLKSGNKPEWMVLDIVPVIPPDLRPMVQLESGRFATSDINDLYRRVINRNNRLRRLLEIEAPEIIIQNEKRMLQEAVDALFNNGRHGAPVVMGNRVLRSLSDLLGGKQGRFRQNLLGKRVDYSGRSVIVVGPHLKFNQCGLPKKMALELFKPFILERLAKQEMLSNIKSAKRMIEEGSEEVWSILEDVVKDHPILLNRAPTLHRLGIQAFMPLLVESKAIQLHPLVCVGFNADFDGDQMAVHVPLSIESQLEARFLMLSSNNLLSPANGRPIATPSQDIVIGCHYLTKESNGEKGEGKYFANADEVITAYSLGIMGLHASIRLQLSLGKGEKKIIGTTVGRVIFNDILPEDLVFVNKTLNKKAVSSLILDCHKKYGSSLAVELLDKIKDLGFEFATKSGLSIGILDIKVPKEKPAIIKEAQEEEDKVFAQYRRGLITDGERYNRVIDIWTRATNKLTDAMLANMKEDQKGFNPLYLMFDSGARGSEQQIRQLAGMRGLMTKPSGEIIELPITTNFREGLNVLEYFISTHGGRKGLADTALKTADAGYLTRRLVDVSHDVIVSEEDCGTVNGINVSVLKEGGETIESLADRILGRVALGDILDPLSGEVIVKDNQEITEDDALRIERAGIEKVRIRTVLTCEAERGVCRKCYGRDLATGKLVNLGEAAGVIAAESIGEPGTQLTMRTFHIGGTAYAAVEEKDIRLKFKVEVVEVPKNLITREKDGIIVANRHGEIVVRRILKTHKIPLKAKTAVFDGLWVTAGERLAQHGSESIASEVTGIVKIDEKNHNIFITGEEYPLPIQAGAEIKVNPGDVVEPNKSLAEFDPYNEPILTEISGDIKEYDLIKGETVREETDKTTGLLERVVIEHKEGKHPRIVVKNKEKEITYSIPVGAHLVVVDGRRVSAGEILVKIPHQSIKTKDITGGLPRVEELFEARHVRDKAIISEVDGKVEFSPFMRGTRKVVIKGERGTREYSIPEGKHLKARDGDEVIVGEPLTSGSVDPHDILAVKGERALQEYLVNEIQAVYRLQGVDINDKHIEIIVRQMLRRVEVTDPGDTRFLSGEQIDKFRFMHENERVVSKGGKPAQGRPILLGITKAALNSDSFIAAASFQETTHILTEAAINGRYDELLGLKENVIIGRLIPAGTGLPIYRNVQMEVSQPVKTAGPEEKKED